MTTTFNSSILLTNNKPQPNAFNLYINKDNTYLYEALDFMNNIDKEFASNKKRLYVSLLEAGNNDIVINESFSNFFDGLKKILDKVVAFIKRIYNKFIININRIFSSDKYIIKNQDKFKNFNTTHEFESNVYNFTLSYSVPLVTQEHEFVENFTKIFINGDNLNNEYNDIADIKKNRQNFVDGLDDWYDKFRATVIGQDGKIFESDFSEELFEVFRDGTNSSTEETITSSYINSAYARFKDYDKYKKSITKSSNEIEKKYNSIKKEVDKIASSSYDTNKVKTMTLSDGEHITGLSSKTTESQEIMTQIDLFVKDKSSQITQMSNIHIMAFAAKLDAAKACMIQDKNILYKALSQMQNKVKTEGVNIYINNLNMSPSDISNLVPISPSIEPESEPTEFDFNFLEDDAEEVPVDIGDIESADEDIDKFVNKLNALEYDEFAECVNMAINNKTYSTMLEEKEELSSGILRSIYSNRTNNIFNETFLYAELSTTTNNMNNYSKDDIRYKNFNIYKECVENRIESLSKYKDQTKDMSNNYLDQSQYNNYLFESYKIAIETEAFINKCITLGTVHESTIDYHISIINEDSSNEKKSAWQKIKDFVKKIWGKFMEKSTNLLASNKTYLDKYKDVILKTRPNSDDTFTMKPYDKGLVFMASHKIPFLNYESQKQQLATEESAQKFLLGITNITNTENFSEECKDKFYGGTEEEEVKANSINMADLFNYCYNYKDTITKIEKDSDAIDKAVFTANDVIAKLVSDKSKEDAGKPEGEANGTNDGKPEGEANGTDAGKPEGEANGTDADVAKEDGNKAEIKKLEGEINILKRELNTTEDRALREKINNNIKTKQDAIKKLNESYISHRNDLLLELNINSNTKGSSGPSSGSGMNKVTSTIGTAKKKDEVKSDMSNKSSEELKEATERIDNYMKTVNTIFSSKLTCAETIYSDYMKIIRHHITQNIDGNTSGSRATQAATNYSLISKLAEVNLEPNTDNYIKLLKDQFSETLKTQSKEQVKNQKDPTFNSILSEIPRLTGNIDAEFLNTVIAELERVFDLTDDDKTKIRNLKK